MASKRIVVTTDVYEGLHRLKLPGESFSDLLRRLTANKGKLSPHFGALAHEPKEFFDGMREIIASLDKASEAELAKLVETH
jgi:predicted CopG family antitoxin